MSGSSGKQTVGGQRREPTERGSEIHRADGIPDPTSRKGGILNALRRSPLVGEVVIPRRPFETGRKVDL